MSPQKTYENRVTIQVLLKERRNQTYIARSIGFNQSNISRELKPFKDSGILYDAKIAQKIYEEKRFLANQLIHTKKIIGTLLGDFIDDYIQKEGWTPECIAGRWKEETGEVVSHPTIYKYIYDYHPDRVVKYLKRKGKVKKKNTGGKSIIKNRVPIHERPKEVEDRSRLGDFEGDTVVGKDKKDRFVTNVDRKSGFLIADIILGSESGKLSIKTSISLFNGLKDLPKDKVKTITLDNGVEFADHEYLQKQLGIQTYFADPYSSRQRGTNERTNGQLRIFYPKGTDFKKIDPHDFAKVVDMINNKPRKKLGRKTPYEVFFEKEISYTNSYTETKK